LDRRQQFRRWCGHEQATASLRQPMGRFRCQLSTVSPLIGVPPPDLQVVRAKMMEKNASKVGACGPGWPQSSSAPCLKPPGPRTDNDLLVPGGPHQKSDVNEVECSPENPGSNASNNPNMVATIFESHRHNMESTLALN
jgi:hypothetical protein